MPPPNIVWLMSDPIYDLAQDPYELDNLMDAPEMQPILREMRHRLRGWMGRHQDDSAWAQRLLEQMG